MGDLKICLRSFHQLLDHIQKHTYQNFFNKHQKDVYSNILEKVKILKTLQEPKISCIEIKNLQKEYQSLDNFLKEKKKEDEENLNQILDSLLLTLEKIQILSKLHILIKKQRYKEKIERIDTIQDLLEFCKFLDSFSTIFHSHKHDLLKSVPLDVYTEMLYKKQHLNQLQSQLMLIFKKKYGKDYKKVKPHKDLLFIKLKNLLFSMVLALESLPQKNVSVEKYYSSFLKQFEKESRKFSPKTGEIDRLMLKMEDQMQNVFKILHTGVKLEKSPKRLTPTKEEKIPLIKIPKFVHKNTPMCKSKPILRWKEENQDLKKTKDENAPRIYKQLEEKNLIQRIWTKAEKQKADVILLVDVANFHGGKYSRILNINERLKKSIGDEFGSILSKYKKPFWVFINQGDYYLNEKNMVHVVVQTPKALSLEIACLKNRRDNCYVVRKKNPLDDLSILVLAKGLQDLRHQLSNPQKELEIKNLYPEVKILSKDQYRDFRWVPPKQK